MKNVYEDEMRLWQPQQRNLFELTVPGLDTFAEGGILSLALTMVALPTETTEKLTMPWLNAEVYFAGKTTIGEFAAEFNDFCDQNTWKALVDWRKQVWNIATHRAGLAADYKKSGTLKMFPPTLENSTPSSGLGTESKVRTWEIKGLWPSSLDPGSASMDDTGRMTINCTLIADKAIPDVGMT